jgi:hypothetical protein
MTPEMPPCFQPLFEDLMRVENLVEVQGRDREKRKRDCHELPDERARLWSTNLSQVAAEWKFEGPREVTLGGREGLGSQPGQIARSFAILSRRKMGRGQPGS